MIKNSLLTILLCLTISLSGFCQTTHATLQLQFPEIENVSIFPIGDSLFFSFKNGGYLLQHFLIMPDGKTEEIQLPAKDFIGVTRKDDSTFFYFLEGRKDLMIKSVFFTGASRKGIPFNETISISSELLGVHRTSRDLCLVLYEPKTMILRLLQIQKNHVISQKEFKLPIPLNSYYKKEGVAVVDSESILPVKAAVKLFVEPSYINIVIDSKEFKTYFLSLNTKTLEVQSKNLPVRDANSSSTYFDGTLFRFFVSPRKFQVDAFKTTTWEQVGHYSLVKEDLREGDFVFEHNGRSNFLKKTPFRWMMSGSNDTKPLINVVARDKGLKIRCANYEELNSTLSYFTGSAGNLLSGLIYSNLMNALITSPHLTRYFYIEWTPEKNEFLRNISTSTAFDKIDFYALQLEQSNTKISFNGHTKFKKGILGVYAQSKEVKFMLFE